MIERLREVLRFENPCVRVFEDEVRFPDGKEGTYLRIGPPEERGAGVVMLPVAGETIGLVETYRYPVSADQWGLPRGFGEAGDEGPASSAARELAEEIGAHDAVLEFLGWVTPDSGMLNTRVAVFIARLAAPVSTPADTVEVREVRWIGFDELWRWVREGTIEDGFTLSALALGLAHGSVPGPARPS